MDDIRHCRYYASKRSSIYINYEVSSRYVEKRDYRRPKPVKALTRGLDIFGCVLWNGTVKEEEEEEGRMLRGEEEVEGELGRRGFVGEGPITSSTMVLKST